MAFVLKRIFPNTSRHSNAGRSGAEQGNACLVYAMGRGLTAAGAARGTTAAKAKTVNTFTFTVSGVFYSLAGSDDFWTMSGATVAAASWQKYLLMVDTSGTASIQEATQSTVSAAGVVWSNVSNLSPWAAYLTAVGSTKCVVSSLTIATDATHTFIPGTTALNAAGITATFVDGVDQSILPVIADQTGAIIGNGG